MLHVLLLVVVVSLVLLFMLLHLRLILLMSGLMQVMLKMLLGLKQVLLQLLGCVLHLKLLRVAMHLHLKLLTQGLKLLHVVMINSDRLMWHWLLGHLVERLAHMVMMIHGVLVHLHIHMLCLRKQHIGMACRIHKVAGNAGMHKT